MNAYLFPSLRLTPGIVEQAFRQVKDIDQPTHPDRFSAREVIAHLAEWEPIMRGRIVQCIENPGSTIVAYDEGQMAIDGKYSESNAEAELEKFKSERLKTIAYLEAMPSDGWQKSCNHPERGTLTAYDLAHFLPCHDVYHIDQLLAVTK